MRPGDSETDIKSAMQATEPSLKQDPDEKWGGIVM
jgi:hypothetical protein